jgi:hypothetical protein
MKFHTIMWLDSFGFCAWRGARESKTPPKDCSDLILPAKLIALSVAMTTGTAMTAWIRSQSILQDFSRGRASNVFVLLMSHDQDQN